MPAPHPVFPAGCSEQKVPPVPTRKECGPSGRCDTGGKHVDHTVFPEKDTKSGSHSYLSPSSTQGFSQSRLPLPWQELEIPSITTSIFLSF